MQQDGTLRMGGIVYDYGYELRAMIMTFEPLGALVTMQ